MSTLKLAILGFVKDYRIKEYSQKELTRVLEDMGYAVIELEGNNEKLILEGSNKEQFFLFDNGSLKYIAIPMDIDQKEKCTRLCFAISKIYSAQNLFFKNITPKAFQKMLYDILCDKSIFSHINRHIFEYVSAITVILVVLCFTITAVFLEKTLDEQIELPDFDKTQQFSEYNANEEEPLVQEAASVFNIIESIDDVDYGITQSIVDEAIVSFSNETPVDSYEKTIYYATKSGTKYHTKNCSYIKDLSKCTQLKYDELDKYQPCKRCIK